MFPRKRLTQLRSGIPVNFPVKMHVQNGGYAFGQSARRVLWYLVWLWCGTGACDTTGACGHVHRGAVGPRDREAGRGAGSGRPGRAAEDYSP